jgi:hypothetical protein
MLRGFPSDVHLDQPLYRSTLPFCFLIQGFPDANAIDGMENPKKTQRRPNLVGLEWTQAVPFDRLRQKGSLPERFLNSVLPETKDAALKGRGHSLERLPFACRHHADGPQRTTSAATCFCNAGLNRRPAVRDRLPFAHGR